MATYEPPPTFADVVLYNEVTGKAQFNPIWLNWFLRLAGVLNGVGGGGGGSGVLGAPLSNGIVVHIGSGITEGRTLQNDAYVSITDADGVGAAPTIGLNLTALKEYIEDTTAALLVAGTNITLTYNDGVPSLTIDASGGGGGGGTWGSITGTLSLQLDLQAALDAKADIASVPVSGAVIVTPTGVLAHEETVAAVGVSAGMRVFPCLAPHSDTDENHEEFLSISALAATAGTNQITVSMAFGELTSGPVRINYMAV